LQIIDAKRRKPADKRRQATGRPTNARPTVGALMNSRELIVSDCMHWRFSISTNTPSAASRRHGVTSKHTVTPSASRHHAITPRVAPSRCVLRRLPSSSASSGV